MIYVRASRLLTIMMTLQLRGRVTAQSLADQLEVSKRTIYRDVDELSASGVPIYADRGPAGGFALLDGYRTDLTGLLPDEAGAVLFAALPGVAADLGLAEAASASRTKLLSALPARGRDQATAIAGRFHVDATDWHRRSSETPHLAEVARAVWDSRLIRIDYESWAKRSWHDVAPLGLVLKAGEWYLVARSGSKVRIHRVAAIRALEPLETRFERPASFDLPATWASQVAAFETGLQRGVATLRVAATAVSRLDRLGAAIAEPLLAATPHPGGWREATVPIETVEHAVGLLLGFSDEIVVVAPDALRNELAARARRVVGLYGDPKPPG